MQQKYYKEAGRLDQVERAKTEDCDGKGKRKLKKGKGKRAFTSIDESSSYNIWGYVKRFSLRHPSSRPKQPQCTFIKRLRLMWMRRPSLC